MSDDLVDDVARVIDPAAFKQKWNSEVYRDSARAKARLIVDLVQLRLAKTRHEEETKVVSIAGGIRQPRPWRLTE